MGTAVGIRTLLGCSLSLEMGKNEGITLGAADGGSLGATDGPRIGMPEGMALGWREGVADGNEIGEKAGEKLGRLLIGADVGLGSVSSVGAGSCLGGNIGAIVGVPGLARLEIDDGPTVSLAEDGSGSSCLDGYDDGEIEGNIESLTSGEAVGSGFVGSDSSGSEMLPCEGLDENSCAVSGVGNNVPVGLGWVGPSCETLSIVTAVSCP